jgi:hypothetical protein
MITQYAGRVWCYLMALYVHYTAGGKHTYPVLPKGVPEIRELVVTRPRIEPTGGLQPGLQPGIAGNLFKHQAH